jgi:hypothetical protein
MIPLNSVLKYKQAMGDEDFAAILNNNNAIIILAKESDLISILVIRKRKGEREKGRDIEILREIESR